MISLKNALQTTYGNKDAIKKLEMGGYKKDTKLSNKNNTVFVNNTNKDIIFGVKGTNPTSLQDIGTDLYLAAGALDKTKRYKDSKNRYNESKATYKGYTHSLMGHSLGASIISRMADKNDKVLAFNEGVSPFQKTRSYGGNHKHIRTEFDPVSVFGANAKHMKTVFNPNTPTGIIPLDGLKAHNVKTLDKHIFL